MRLRAGLTLAAGATGALALAGCGSTIEPGSIQTSIAKVVKSQGLGVKSVKCPDGEPAKKGQQFTCSLTLSSGEQEPVLITETNDNGHYNERPKDEIATGVAKELQQAFASKSISVTASCPRHVPIKVGGTFTCAVTDTSGGHATAQITMTDLSGGFRIGKIVNGT